MDWDFQDGFRELDIRGRKESRYSSKTKILADSGTLYSLIPILSL